MPGAYKRESAARYTIWWKGADGKRKFGTGTADKKTSMEIAQKNDAEGRLIREGMIDPGERKQREASLRPIADHVDDYEQDLLDSGDVEKHAKHTASTLKRLFASANIVSASEIIPDQIRSALGRMRTVRSPRTCNHALTAVKSFARWLAHGKRIREIPAGLLALKPYSEKIDRKRVRRALTFAELAKLLAATESGPDQYVYGPTKSKLHKIPITGQQRAALYRLAMGTGFRANELRILTPESFALDGDDPSVRLEAGEDKGKRGAVQPITRELAAGLRPFVQACEAGKPVLIVPDKTALMLRRDLERAEIPYKDASDRVVDFHALRHSYITHLIMSGANPKVVQALARHSTITLTLDRYCHIENTDMRVALEKTKADNGRASEGSDSPVAGPHHEPS